MFGRQLICWALGSALLALTEGFISVNRSSSRMTLDQVKENLGDFVRQGFANLETRSVLPNDASRYSTDYHGRKVDLNLRRSLSCMAKGNRNTRRLILDRLEIPEGMSTKEALGNLTYKQEVCLMARKACGVEDSNSADETSNIENRIVLVRSFDGSLNNIWFNYGQAGSAFLRFQTPVYLGSDCGLVDRGNPREISNIVAAQRTTDREDVTLMLMQFGQFLDHDLTLIHELVEFDECCSKEHEDECADVDISKDSFYREFGKTCHPFAKTLTTESSCNIGGCENKINFATAFLDGSQIYGNSADENSGLRLGSTAFMKTSSVSEIQIEDKGVCDCLGISHEFLQFLPTSPDGFLTGDIRANEQPGLTSIHTVFVRYHNLLASLILQANDLFTTDENAFQEARKFTIASLQHIAYHEFLPLLMSKSHLAQFRLDDVEYKYDFTQLVGTIEEFAAAAYRMGHTLISDFFGKVPLVENFFNSKILKSSGTTPSFFLGTEASQTAEQFDTFFVDTLRNKLFAEDSKVGQDLMLRNIQRGRDHGLRSFNDYRVLFGLTPITPSNIDTEMRPGAGELLLKAYAGSFSRKLDMDLFPAGLAEKPQDKGDKLGPVFTSIIGRQFEILKFGDRFWYENNLFSDDELAAIKQTTLADIFCEVTCIKQIQQFAMAPISKKNPQRSCLERRTRPNHLTVVSLLKKRLQS